MKKIHQGMKMRKSFGKFVAVNRDASHRNLLSVSI